MKTEIYTVVCQKILASYEQGCQVPEFVAQTRLTDLQLDSLSILEVIFELENHFSISVEDHLLATAKTVADICHMIEISLPGGSDTQEVTHHG